MCQLFKCIPFICFNFHLFFHFKCSSGCPPPHPSPSCFLTPSAEPPLSLTSQWQVNEAYQVRNDTSSLTTADWHFFLPSDGQPCSESVSQSVSQPVSFQVWCISTVFYETVSHSIIWRKLGKMECNVYSLYIYIFFFCWLKGKFQLISFYFFYFFYPALEEVLKKRWMNFSWQKKRE